jgi:hypothetical protein
MLKQSEHLALRVEADSPLEVEMIGIAVITVLCAAGVSFDVRFLVALGYELRYARISYLVRV